MTYMSLLSRVKTRIGISDAVQDDLLTEIIANTSSELQSKLSAKYSLIPYELQFIVVEVSVKRYNRTGSEGMTSETIDGRSNSFEDDDFKQYADILKKYSDVDTGTGEVLFF